MRLLLDTHTFIWYATDNPKLSNIARSLVLYIYSLLKVGI